MANDIMTLNPEVLIGSAKIINAYCIKQEEILDDYISRINNFRGMWDDDKTMGSLCESIAVSNSQIKKLLDEINSVFPAYFQRKAEEIKNRPTL